MYRDSFNFPVAFSFCCGAFPTEMYELLISLGGLVIDLYCLLDINPIHFLNTIKYLELKCSSL
jgi:hypothetical protein